MTAESGAGSVAVTGPAAGALVVGAWLRQQRRAKGRSRQEIARVLGRSVTALRHAELGQVFPRDLGRLLAAYGRDTQLEVIRHLLDGASDSGFSRDLCGDVFPGRAERLDAVMAQATVVRTVTSAHLPAGLQTPAYATALRDRWPLAEGRPVAGPHGPRSLAPGTVVLDEGVLLRGCGGPQVMAEQLAELIAAIERGMDIRVRPLACAQMMPAGTLSELFLHGRALVVETTLAGVVYATGPAAQIRRAVLDRVMAHAEPAAASARTLRGAYRACGDASFTGSVFFLRACWACALRQEGGWS